MQLNPSKTKSRLSLVLHQVLLCCDAFVCNVISVCCVALLLLDIVLIVVHCSVLLCFVAQPLLLSLCSGIGRATAVELAKRGASVVVGARRVDELEKLVKEITSAGGKAVAVRLDVTEEKDHIAIVKAALDNFGGLDIAVNNAGMVHLCCACSVSHFVFMFVVQFAHGSLTEQSVADLDRMLRVNVLGVALGIKHQVMAMKANTKSKGGVIVNISSAIAMTSSKALPASMYATTKWAVNGLTENAATEFSELGIRVVAVNPGVTITEMVNEEFGAKLASKVRLCSRCF